VVISPFPNQSIPTSQASLTVPLNQIFSDDNGVQNLSFSVTNVSNPGLVTNTQINGNQLVITFNQLVGSSNFTVRATDAQQLFVESSFQVERTEQTQQQLVEIVRINSGGPTLQIANQSWVADQYFSGGSTYSNNSAIANTTSDPIYQSERWGNFTYAIPVPQSGQYLIELHFAEIAGKSTGQRVFNVAVENSQFTRSNIDLAALFGPVTAGVIQVPNINVTDGFINITMTSVVNNAKISGIALHHYAEATTSELARMRPAVSDENLSDMELENNGVTLYPNPNESEFTVTVHVEETSLWSFNFSNVAGTNIPLGSSVLEKGLHNVEFDLREKNIKPGFYYLFVDCNTQRKKILKVLVK
jgi:hypothetical protein